jgi:hypothetical protein
MELVTDTISILNKIDGWIAAKGSAVLSTPVDDLHFLIEMEKPDHYVVSMVLPDPIGALSGAPGPDRRFRNVQCQWGIITHVLNASHSPRDPAGSFTLQYCRPLVGSYYTWNRHHRHTTPGSLRRSWTSAHTQIHIMSRRVVDAAAHERPRHALELRRYGGRLFHMKLSLGMSAGMVSPGRVWINPIGIGSRRRALQPALRPLGSHLASPRAPAASPR